MMVHMSVHQLRSPLSAVRTLSKARNSPPRPALAPPDASLSPRPEPPAHPDAPHFSGLSQLLLHRLDGNDKLAREVAKDILLQAPTLSPSTRPPPPPRLRPCPLASSSLPLLPLHRPALAPRPRPALPLAVGAPRGLAGAL